MPSPPEKPTAVIYTWEALGHLIPAVHLSNLFLARGFAVALAVARLPAGAGPSPSTIAGLVSSNPSISFHFFPPPDHDAVAELAGDHAGMIILHSIRLCRPHLLALLNATPAVSHLVLDCFCVDELAAGRAAGVLTSVFFTSGAAALAVYWHLPALHESLPSSFKDMEKTLVHVPGTPAIRASDFPPTLHDRDSQWYKTRIEQFARIAEADGVLINSFEWLEARAMAVLRGSGGSPVYCVGPIISTGDGGAARHESLKWLDSQPDGSVVFLCFGTGGGFSGEQLKEIARGLERSGRRFLWVVKSPKLLAGDDDHGREFAARPEPDLAALLPAGFLARTSSAGMVVPSWAPQRDVLEHRATAAFVTHCGWNSVLEAVAAGVAMVCWPLYAEQRMNKTFVVEEMGLGVEIEGYDAEIVTGDEVEKKIQWVMGEEEGMEMRKRARVAKEKAAEAVMDGGPSAKAFDEFLASTAAGGSR